MRDKEDPELIAHEALEPIAAQYAIEGRIRGRSAEEPDGDETG